MKAGRDEARDNSKINEHVVIGTAGSIFGKMEQRKLDCKNSLKCIVLDEADYLMGSSDTTNIIKHKMLKGRKLQIIAFSATFSEQNAKKCKSLLKNPIEIEVKEKKNLVLKDVKQYFMRCIPDMKHILHVLSELFGCNLGIKQMIVFVNQREYGTQVAQHLRDNGHTVGELYGGKGKFAMDAHQRDKVLSDFINKKTTRLVSTDVIGRGIDIPEVTHVISIEVPRGRDKKVDPEAYLQRVGRAGRMGRKGVAITLVADTGNFVQEVLDLGKHWGCTIEEVPAYEDKAKPEDIPEELWDEKFKVV